MEPRTIEQLLEAQKQAVSLHKQWTGTAQEVHSLLNSVTWGCHVESLRLENTSLSCPNFDLATIASCHFADCTMTGAVFTEASVSDSIMNCCDFGKSNFFNANLRNCALNNSNFSGCHLTGAKLHQCDLTGAQFWGGMFGRDKL